jgi:anionic cell wall polymer biosynthesis LytR-Cps2A-Psr (LCP) family protein
MINYFGGVNINVPEQIEYRGDALTLILVKGKQNMKGDTLLKYIRYLDTLGERGMNYQASVMTQIFESVFRPSLVSKAERVYSNISNSLETNISIVDFSSMRETINAMAENGFKVKRTAETPQEFTEEQS